MPIDRKPVKTSSTTLQPRCRESPEARHRLPNTTVVLGQFSKATAGVEGAGRHTGSPESWSNQYDSPVISLHGSLGYSRAGILHQAETENGKSQCVSPEPHFTVSPSVPCAASSNSLLCPHSPGVYAQHSGHRSDMFVFGELVQRVAAFCLAEDRCLTSETPCRQSQARQRALWPASGSDRQW